MLFNSLTVPGSESKLLNSYCAESRGGEGEGGPPDFKRQG